MGFRTHFHLKRGALNETMLFLLFRLISAHRIIKSPDHLYHDFRDTLYIGVICSYQDDMKDVSDDLVTRLLFFIGAIY